jgi:type II secretory pathway component GspD/PulD (secretin)
MRRQAGKFLIPAIILALSLCVPATAGESALDARVTLDLDNAELHEVFDIYKELLKVELDIDPTIDGRITVSFDNITVRTSLNVICESAGCRWELLGDELRVFRVDRDDAPEKLRKISLSGKEPGGDVFKTHKSDENGYSLDSPVSLKLSNADATTLLELTAEVIGAKLLVNRDLKDRTISINAEKVPLSTVLNTMCSEVGCVWKLTEGNPPTLEVDLP